MHHNGPLSQVTGLCLKEDLKKLTAIVNWKTLENATALAGFLGLTGWFRDLIMGYAEMLDLR